MDEYDDGPYWVILLMYGSHDMRHTGFHRLTVVNGTLGFWGVTERVSGLSPRRDSLLYCTTTNCLVVKKLKKKKRSYFGTNF